MRISRIATERSRFFGRQKSPRRHFPHGTKLRRSQKSGPAAKPIPGIGQFRSAGHAPIGKTDGKSGGGNPRKNPSKNSRKNQSKNTRTTPRKNARKHPRGNPKENPKEKPQGKNPRETLRRRSLVPCGKCRCGHFCRQKNQQPSIAIRGMRKIGKVAALTASGA